MPARPVIRITHESIRQRAGLPSPAPRLPADVLLWQMLWPGLAIGAGASVVLPFLGGDSFFWSVLFVVPVSTLAMLVAVILARVRFRRIVPAGQQTGWLRQLPALSALVVGGLMALVGVLLYLVSSDMNFVLWLVPVIAAICVCKANWARRPRPAAPAPRPAPAPVRVTATPRTAPAPALRITKRGVRVNEVSLRNCPACQEPMPAGAPVLRCKGPVPHEHHEHCVRSGFIKRCGLCRFAF